MSSFTTKALFSSKRTKQLAWFIAFYIISIIVIGAFYFLTHTILGWLA
jgi:hypothetical protein